MTLWQKLLIVLASLAAAFAFGRFSAPEKVRIETKTVEVEKKVQDSQLNIQKHQVTTTVETKKPDGEVVKTTTTTTDTDADKKTHEVVQDTKQTDQIKEITRGSSPVTVSALVGVAFDGFRPVYGGSVSRPLLGPVTLGVWALSSPAAGISVGLQF